MSQRYLEDPAIVSLNKPTAAEGIESLTKYVRDSTGEVRHLLMNECDVIYECRYCRAMFRSIIHFVSHKRSHCRGTHEALSSNAKIAKKAFDDELEKIERENRNKDHSKRNTSLRQRNLVSVLNKRSADITVPIPGTTELLNLHTLPRICKQVPVTTFIDGVQKIVDCPASLAHKEGIPSDQVVLVVPQDHTSKYGEMQLRNRREAATKRVISKMTTQKEREALARCQEVVPFSFDVGPNRCRYSGCEEIKNFENILAMAYHIAIKHVIFVESDPKSCLLCDEMFTNVVNYREHLIDEHADVRKAHDVFRSKSEIDKKKKKGHREASRSRSMSRPPLDADVPVLQAETSKQDYDDSVSGDTDEEPPTLQCELSADDSNDVPIRKLRTRPSIESVFAKTKRVTRSSSLTSTPRTNPSTDGFSNIGNSSTEGTQEDVTLRKAERTPENGDSRFEKDIDRITRFLIQKADAGLFQASLSEIVSSGEASLNASGRNTPHIPLSIVEANDVCNSDTANTTVTNESAVQDSDDATLAFHKERLNIMDNDKQSQSSSPETDNDNEADSEGRLTVRQRSSRTRKRPEWMTTDYVMSDEKETPSVPPKKNRTTDSSSPSSRSSPAIENVSPQKQLLLIKAMSLKKPVMPVRAQIAHRHHSAEPRPDIVLPTPSSRTTNNSKATADFQSTMGHLTPRAKKMHAEALGITLTTPDVPSSPGSSRRKQDMSQVAEKPVRDLATVPVYLSHHQKELFFSGLKQQNGEIAPLSDSKPQKDHDGSNGPFVCEYCNETVPNLKDGRRHMVSHIRVMRLRCKLCKAGAFFCTDMRAHLMDRSCPKLDMAPTGIVKPGHPCMTKLEADELTEIADTSAPGRVMYTSGEIVSSTNRVPYFPDPVIEEKILGQGRLLAGRNSSS